jgi:hypothetical protein
MPWGARAASPRALPGAANREPRSARGSSRVRPTQHRAVVLPAYVRSLAPEDARAPSGRALGQVQHVPLRRLESCQSQQWCPRGASRFPFECALDVVRRRGVSPPGSEGTKIADIAGDQGPVLGRSGLRPTRATDDRLGGGWCRFWHHPTTERLGVWGRQAPSEAYIATRCSSRPTHKEPPNRGGASPSRTCRAHRCGQANRAPRCAIRRRQGLRPRHQVGPWVPAIPLKVGPGEAGGDIDLLPEGLTLLLDFGLILFRGVLSFFSG